MPLKVVGHRAVVAVARSGLESEGRVQALKDVRQGRVQALEERVHRSNEKHLERVPGQGQVLQMHGQRRSLDFQRHDQKLNQAPRLLGLGRSLGCLRLGQALTVKGT